MNKNKIVILISVIVCTFIILTACTDGGKLPVVFAPEEVYKEMNIIPDSVFEQGFTVVSQKDHSNGDSTSELGIFSYGNTDLKPLWSLAQWDSGPCIWANNVSDSEFSLTDGSSKWVNYDPEEKSLLLRLNTEPYYQGKGAVAGDYWPHLLIEQNFPFQELSEDEKCFRTGGMDDIVLSFDIRMPYYSATSNPDNWVEAAQLYMYFGVVDKVENKFVWFGLQLFDSRYEFSELSYKIDDGKSDASGLPIYLIGMKDVYSSSNGTLWKNGAPTASEDWLHVELDLKPHLENMMNIAVENGYYREGTTLSDLFFHYMNYGWEIIATYDCGVEIKNLHLDTGYTEYFPE